ncbi:MAG: hypothetical protein ACJ747_14820 [Gaiellaceae bacterium]|jgi:hypothetical protein
MRAVTSIAAILAVAWTTGCGSANDSGEASGSARTDAAKQALKNFYAAANDADGGRACGYLTMDGIRQIVRVRSRPDCVRTVGALSPGSFAGATGDADLVDVEHVEEREGAVDVEAEVHGRSGGTYRLVDRRGMLLIDGFEPEEK